LEVPGLENSDRAYPELVLSILPNALAAVVAAALLAVLMSSADSYIIGPASLMMNDFYRVWRTDPSHRELMTVSRIFTVLFAVMGLVAALQFQVIIGLILAFLVIGWAILPAYFASTMWRRASRHAAFWSMLVGAALNAYLYLNPPAVFGDSPPYYTGWIGFSAALVILIVGSYLWPDERFVSDRGDGYREALNGMPPQ
jgi:Na+/proline symporter